ncbi:MAG: tRNA (5-methylaminomethyl-2-thiouridine)(34)-methyltransferase MnmD [Coprobacter sp.]|nr:tRNA (5-methylaminomethyl-2-thiouridine)(34)-methyltransferase MnmD [Coprobacter sp.]
MHPPIPEITADGSATLYLPDMDEHYHSVKGAVGEARHVYLETALHATTASPVRVLEIGFGTGLNAFLTALDARHSGRPVIYTALERYPLTWETAAALRYPEHIDPQQAPLFRQLHEADWNRAVTLTPGFTLRKVETDLTRYRFTDTFDVVYFDAFAPDKQPEMWDEEIFVRIAAALAPGGVLGTYCAKGEVRRRLQRAGFTVERLPGPVGGKREILRARI